MKQHLLTFFAVLVLAHALPLVLDNYRTTGVVHVDSTTDGSTSTKYSSAEAIIGRGRRISLHRVSTFPDGKRAVCGVTGNQLLIGTDMHTKAKCRVDYNGFRRGISPPVDFSDGCDCWLLRFSESDAGIAINMRATNDVVEKVSSYTMMDFSDYKGVDICIPFNGDQAHYSSITRIIMELETMTEGADAAIDYTCAAPRVSCWHDAPENVVTGVSTTITVSCENYASFPVSTESLEVSLEIPSALGSIQSVSCNKGSTVTQTNNFTTTVDLASEETISCDIDAMFTSPGEMQVQAVIVNTNSGVEYRSGLGGNRAGIISICSQPYPTILTAKDP